MLTNIYPEVDKVLSVHDAAIDFLAEIDHMLVLNDDGSRTVDESGPLVRSFNS